MNIVKGAKVAFLIIFYMKVMNVFLLKFLTPNQPQDFTKPNPATVMIFLAIIFFVFHTNNPAVGEHSNSSSPFDELSCLTISEISSIPILDPSPKNLMVPTKSALRDRHVDENILMIEGSDILDERCDEVTSHPLLLLEYKNMETEYEAARIQQEEYPMENELIISLGAQHDEIRYNNGENRLSPSRDCQKSLTIYDHGYMSGAEMDEYSNFDTCHCGYEGDSEDNGYSKPGDLNKKIEEFIAANRRVWRDDLIKEKSLYLGVLPR